MTTLPCINRLRLPMLSRTHDRNSSSGVGQERVSGDPSVHGNKTDARDRGGSLCLGFQAVES